MTKLSFDAVNVARNVPQLHVQVHGLPCAARDVMRNDFYPTCKNATLAELYTIITRALQQKCPLLVSGVVPVQQHDTQVFHCRMLPVGILIAYQNRLLQSEEFENPHVNVALGDLFIHRDQKYVLRIKPVCARPKHAPRARFDICIKDLNGNQRMLPVTAAHKISKVKEDIHMVLNGAPPVQQRLIHKSFNLEDKHTLREYGIHAGDVIHLVLRLPGGMLHVSSGRSDYCSTRAPTPVHKQNNTQSGAVFYPVSTRVTYTCAQSGTQSTLVVYRHPASTAAQLSEMVRMETQPDFFDQCAPKELERMLAARVNEYLSESALQRFMAAFAKKSIVP